MPPLRTAPQTQLSKVTLFWPLFAHIEHVEEAPIVRAKVNQAESALFKTRYIGKFNPDPYYPPKLNHGIRHLYDYKR